MEKMNFCFIRTIFNDTIMNIGPKLVISLRSIPKEDGFMNLYTVSLFGHRQIDNVFVIEQQLETLIRELLITKEYVEFLIGRDGEFNQLVASTVRRCKRVIRDDNSALVLILPYTTAEYKNNEQSFHGCPFRFGYFLRRTQFRRCLSNYAVYKESKCQHYQFARRNLLTHTHFFKEGQT